jgi:hypothetical protein
MPPNGLGGGAGARSFVERVPAWPARDTCDAELAPLAGVWTGYVLGRNQASTNPPLPAEGRMRLSLGAGGAEGCGSLTFGEPVELAPATDPEAVYPPGTTAASSFSFLEGFAYRLLDASLEGERLRFRIAYSEPWSSWCRLQTPYCDKTFGGFHCSTVTAFNDHGDGTCFVIDASTGRDLAPVSCAQAGYCRNDDLCLCDGAGCDANVNSTTSIEFDLHVSSDDATGSASDQVAHLKKVVE